MMKRLLAAAFAATLIAPSAFAQSAPKTPVAETQIEIFKIAPGQHEAFLRSIAEFDEDNIKAGLPPRQLFIHDNGADWDFLIMQPAHNSPEANARLEQITKARDYKGGINYFLQSRKFFASHTDTVTSGPTTAADYLSGIKR
jgi:hypothetical protein